MNLKFTLICIKDPRPSFRPNYFFQFGLDPGSVGAQKIGSRPLKWDGPRRVQYGLGAMTITSNHS